MEAAEINKLSQHQFEHVVTSDALVALCKQLKNAKVITLDTEFVRTRTLKPKLGLLQVFDGKHLALIDPIVICDMEPFCDILRDESILKVFHSCSEDIDALHSNLGVTPSPLFDTQFAASILSYGASIGYAKLVENFFDITLDKGESRTDWIARPLSSKQLSYAAADVTYLMALYERLSAEVQQHDLHSAVLGESEALIQKKIQAFPSEYAYLQLSNNWKLRGHKLLALKLLAQWRLDVAREKDIAINFVVKEAVMYEIAMKMPLDNTQLGTIHGLYGKQLRLYGADIVKLSKQAHSANESEFCEKPQRLIEFSLHKQATADIKLIIEKVAEQTNIPIPVLASKKQISQVLKWCWFDIDENELQGLVPDMLNSWRRVLFIEELEKLFGENRKYETLRSL